MNILFATGNFDRRPEYQVRTKIYEDGGNLVVRKYATNDLAYAHLEKIFRNTEIINRNIKDLSFPRVIKKDQSYLEFEYLDFPSLKYLVEEALIKHEFKGTVIYIKMLDNLIRRAKSKRIDIYKNKDFIRYFDPDKKFNSKKTEICVNETILDLNLDNLLLKNDQEIYLIDYEWVYSIPAPKRFLLFRSLFYLSHQLQSVIQTMCSERFSCYEIFQGTLVPKIWFDLFSFSQDEIERFINYEFNFQQSVTVGEYKVENLTLFEEKKFVNSRYNPNLEIYMSGLLNERDRRLELSQQDVTSLQHDILNLQQENALFKEEKNILENNLEKLSTHASSLQQQIITLKALKIFKVWRVYRLTIDKLLVFKQRLIGMK